MLARILKPIGLDTELIHGQWFTFRDTNGHGYCQPDYYIVLDGYVLLIECKLTQNEAAERQMLELYKPILEHIYQVPVVCVQVCKHLRTSPRNRIDDLVSFIYAPKRGVHTMQLIE